MRLPYFYQQMLGFFAVIIALLYISVFSFYHFTRNTIVNRAEETLVSNAETLVSSYREYGEISREQQFIENQEMDFFVVAESGDVVYSSEHFNLDEIEQKINEEMLHSGETLTTTLEAQSFEGEIVFSCVPFFDEETGDYAGFVGVSTPLSQVQEQVSALESHLFRAFFISSVMAIILSALLARYQVNRINRLRRAAKQVSEGDYDVRIEYKDRDELDNLSRDFNRMILELEEASKEVERQEERRKTFMQDAAHEMRTPLTTINGLLEGLEYGVIDEKNQMRSIQLMSKETKRLIRLVNENLDYENIRSNHIKLTKHHVPLSEIFEDIEYQMNKLAEESHNELIIEDTGSLTIYADFDRLKQILVNLIKNAIQFTNNGKVRVSAEKTQLGTRISVEDDGIGMTKEQTKNIWERYYKADTSRMNTKYGESGLGLSIVQQLVSMHDAALELYSEPGEGTVFRIEFPDSAEKAKKLRASRPADIIE